MGPHPPRPPKPPDPRPRPPQPPAALSFKCRIYGDRPHSPCSGTTDDGTAAPCECWCHDSRTTAEIQDLYAWLEGEIRHMDRMTDALRHQPSGPGAHYLSLTSQAEELRHVREHMRQRNTGLHPVAGVDDR